MFVDVADDGHMLGAYPPVVVSSLIGAPVEVAGEWSKRSELNIPRDQIAITLVDHLEHQFHDVAFIDLAPFLVEEASELLPYEIVDRFTRIDQRRRP